MFERSLVISPKSHASAERCWTATASVAVQISLAALIVALPLFRPESLPFLNHAPKVFLPIQKMPEVKPADQNVATIVNAATQANPYTAPRQIPIGIDMREEPPTQTVSPMGDLMGPAGVLTALRSDAAKVVNATPRQTDKPVAVSTGVITGLLLAPIAPIYPAIATATHVEGAVVVEAVISKTGKIESQHVISGPEMLRNAAMQAIEAARYRPFLLNGQPTEVQTTITVNFKLAS